MALGAVLGSAAGGLLEAGINAWSQHKTNKSNEAIAQEANAASARQAQDQMAFQEKLSNTSYQRAMEDMRKAGLNPILAYSQGGASTPSGAMGDVKAPKLDPVRVDGISSSAQSAMQNYMQLRRDDSQLKLQDEQRNQTAAATQKTLSETERQKVETYNSIQAQKRAAEVHRDAASARRLQKMEADWDSEYLRYNKINDAIQKGTSTVEGAGDAAWSILGGGLIKKLFRVGASSAKDAGSIDRFRKYFPRGRRASDKNVPKNVDPYTGEF